MLLGLLGLISGKVIVTFQEAGRMVRTPHSSSHMGHRLACWGLSGSAWVIHGLHKSSRKVRRRQVLLFMCRGPGRLGRGRSEICGIRPRSLCLPHKHRATIQFKMPRVLLPQHCDKYALCSSGDHSQTE